MQENGKCFLTEAKVPVVKIQSTVLSNKVCIQLS